ncbi:MAG: hypothetical protein PUC47_11210 [Oscillospiraceae bacterium]|nr:hypothetical protein [Oscillospiraceae bacterium]
MSDQKIETLRSLLEALICEKETRIDSFLAEDVEAYLDFAEGMDFVDEAIDYVQVHPHASAQELYHMIDQWAEPGVYGETLEEFEAAMAEDDD